MHGRDAQGRRLAGTPKPYEPPEVPAGKVNVTDPDSKLIKASEGYVQGYNAQAVVDEGQIVLAAEITNASVDWSQLAPMVAATLAELARAGSAGRIQTALADAQYWNEQHMDEVTANTARAGADPARRRRQRQATQGVDRRALQLDALRTQRRGRQRAVSKTQTNDRAGIRPLPPQQRCHAIPQARPQSGAHRVAIN